MSTTTYITAWRRNSKTVHLSADGKWTLCEWRIGDHWQRYDERLSLVATWFSSVRLCQQCERAAIAARKEEAAP